MHQKVLLTVPTPGLKERFDADLKEHRILQTQHDATRGLWVKEGTGFCSQSRWLCAPNVRCAHPRIPSCLQTGKVSASAQACEEAHAAECAMTHMYVRTHTHTLRSAAELREVHRIQQK